MLPSHPYFIKNKTKAEKTRNANKKHTENVSLKITKGQNYKVNTT